MVICKKCGGEAFKVIESRKDFTKNTRIRKKICLTCGKIYITKETFECEVKGVGRTTETI